MSSDLTRGGIGITGGVTPGNPGGNGRSRRLWSLAGAAFSLCVLALSSPQAYAYITYADSPDFTINTAGIILNVGGAASADSADFGINTLGLNPDIGGAAHADSGNFTLNTRADTPLAVGGVAYADSANFSLNTRFGTPLAVGGFGSADSANFTLNTVFGTAAAVGGSRFGDSANFIVSTRFGTVLAVGVGSFADSADFTLDTGGAHPSNISTALGFAINGSSLAISWPVAAGSFSLQFTTNLSPPNWTTLSNPPATLGTNFVSTIAATNPMEFFRLKSN